MADKDKIWQINFGNPESDQELIFKDFMQMSSRTNSTVSKVHTTDLFNYTNNNETDASSVCWITGFSQTSDRGWPKKISKTVSPLAYTIDSSNALYIFLDLQ